MHIYERTIDKYKAKYDPITVIQYKYFYPYNDWWNNHEGDWQGIDVVVSSRDPATAEFLGVEYRFHGAWLSYYKDYGDKPGITNRVVFDPERAVRLIDTHPVAYIGAGSHAAYPIGGEIELHFTDTGGNAGTEGASGTVGGDEGVRGEVGGDREYMSHTGLVLSTLADGSHSDLWESYNLVLLPDPDPTNTNNMGLTPDMSWLGARILWGTPVVHGPGGNKSPKGPYNRNYGPNSKSRGWGDLKLFTAKTLYGDTFHHSDLETHSYHHWAIIGDETWSGTISLSGDVVVFPGATLTIQAGTTVEFSPDDRRQSDDRHQFKEGNDRLSEIFVYGTLKSEGTSSSPVVFRGSNVSDDERHSELRWDWGGIRMMAGSSDTVRHTQVRNVPLPSVRPTNLRVVVGDGAVTLRWEEPSPSDASITGWQYRTKPETATTWGDWEDVSGRSTHEAVVSSLAHGLRHQFEVWAVNATGSGPASAVSASLLEVAFIEPIDPVRAIRARYTLIESGKPVVFVRGVRGQAEDPALTANKVQVGVQLTPATDRRVTIPITVTAGSAESADYEVRGLPASGRLVFGVGRALKEFRIWANADADFDDETIQLSFGALPAGVQVGRPASAMVTIYDTPSAPMGLEAEGGDGQVTLRWDDPDNRSIAGWEYQQRRIRSSWSEWLPMKASNARTTEYLVKDLTNGGNYLFKVRAVTTRGLGDESASVAARPSSFIAEAAPGAVRLRWDDPGDAAIDHWEYRVRRVPDKWGPWEPIAGSAATTTEHTVRELDSGVLYRFKVRAVSSSGAAVLTLAAVEATPQVPCQLTGATDPTFAENAPGAVGTYTASAGCDSALSWGLAGTDARFFELKGDGMSRTLEFNSSHSPPNFEQPADAGANNTYAVSVSIGDASVSVTVSVTDANDAGVISLSTTAPRAEESLTATLSDEDGIAEPVYWTPHYESTSDRDGVTGPASEATQTWTLTIPSSRVGQPLRLQADYTDSFGAASATSALTSPVRPASNRAPSVSGPAAVDIAENSSAPWLLGTYIGRDPDGDELTWSVTGTDASAFELKEPASPGAEPSRELHLANAADYETQDSL